MKVTAFVGSPRKNGNSDTLTDKFLEGAKEAGAEVKKFFLADYEINQCKGCFRNCMLKPGFKCSVHEDDMYMLHEEWLSSDLVLFASPLYSASFTSIMARFFERSIPLLHFEVVGRPGTKEGIKIIDILSQGKKAVIALVQDLIYPQVGELPLKAFEYAVGRTHMMDIVEKIHVVDVRDKGDINKKQDELDKAYNLGNKLALE
ncbi:flavodoxin family protein [Spirochaetota bacterium]